jgi:membrane-associated protein
MLVVAVAAIAGDAVNYAIGRSAWGRLIIRRNWVKPHHQTRTREWFDRYGGPTITVGRFVPIVRTAAPFLAGLSGMPARRFVVFNVIGGVLWCGSLMATGYWLGQFIWVREHLHWLSLLTVVVSVTPIAIHALAERRKTRGFAHAGAVGRR